MRIKSAIAIAGALAALTVAAAPAGAATLQPVGQFSSPVYVTSDPNDAARLFVVERGGAIRLIANGTTTTFMDATTLVLSGGEQGLLSMAFAPDFAQTGRFYVYYTSRPGGDIQIDEFTASGDRADLATRRPILTVPHRDAGNHNGGQLQFGPDGYLYVGDRRRRRRRRHLPQRAEPRGPARQDAADRPAPPERRRALRSPRRQPVRRRGAGADEIWSYRPAQPLPLLLRPPDRRAPDRRRRPEPARGGRLRAPAECRAAATTSAGAAARASSPSRPPTLSAPAPPASPTRSTTTRIRLGCSVTGGYVARDPSLGDLVGRYVYADYCAGRDPLARPRPAAPRPATAPRGSTSPARARSARTPAATSTSSR